MPVTMPSRSQFARLMAPKRGIRPALQEPPRPALIVAPPATPERQPGDDQYAEDYELQDG